MKVLLINGSPHAKGSTYTALHEMEKIFAEGGIETEIVHVGNQAIMMAAAALPAVLAQKQENVHFRILLMKPQRNFRNATVSL